MAFMHSRAQKTSKKCRKWPARCFFRAHATGLRSSCPAGKLFFGCAGSFPPFRVLVSFFSSRGPVAGLVGVEGAGVFVFACCFFRFYRFLFSYFAWLHLHVLIEF
jgi:hypothetical protein